jgi:heme/copper-type cytochrome/quinol oxidase subunit 1
MLSERAGRWNFWLMFIGFNLVFFPMHQLGLNGMPRRVYTYLPETGWGTLNMIASLGAFILAGGVLVFVINVIWARYAGAVAGDNPWAADSLEWATTSPASNCRCAGGARAEHYQTRNARDECDGCAAGAAL